MDYIHCCAVVFVGGQYKLKDYEKIYKFYDLFLDRILVFYMFIVVRCLFWNSAKTFTLSTKKRFTITQLLDVFNVLESLQICHYLP